MNLLYEQIQINRSFKSSKETKNLKCYAPEEVNLPEGEYLVINAGDRVFTLEKTQKSFRCQYAGQSPTRIWNGPYDYCIRMLIRHLKVIKGL